MWRPCSRIVDEPNKVGPFELTDALFLVSLFAVIGFFTGMVFSVMAVGGKAYGLYRLKRGKPYGALLHRLHALELLRLPGFLSPRRVRYGAY
jgi:hypothetical protein